MVFAKILCIIESILIIIQNPPFEYYKDNMILNHKPQVVHTLDIDMNSPFVDISQALSFDKIYGFEQTSKMVEAHEGLVGINGMFYDMYGRHIGGMIENGQVITLPYSKTPIICVDKKGHASIKDIDFYGQAEGELETIQFNRLNEPVSINSWILYSPIYGYTTRVNQRSLNIVVRNGSVKDIIWSDEPQSIPLDGYVLTYVTKDTMDIPFTKHEKIEISYIGYEDLSNIEHAFQSGGWLIKEHEKSNQPFEPLIGNTAIPSPRTILGITKDNHIIIKVIDGRQLGKSIGITGNEAAELMKASGCSDAVYLDGGASSTLVIKNKVINTPSNQGQERKIAHCLLFKLNFK